MFALSTTNLNFIIEVFLFFDQKEIKMNMKKLLIDFVITFAATLVVTAIVTFLYSFIVYGAGTIDWGTSYSLAITLGVVLPWMRARESKEKEK
jgi:hypothetical protein